MVEGHSLISTDVIARYAADAALETDGVRRLVEGARPRHQGVRVSESGGKLAVELHVELEWGASAPSVGSALQERVAEYLGRMTDLGMSTVDVVVEDVAPPTAGA